MINPRGKSRGYGCSSQVLPLCWDKFIQFALRPKPNLICSPVMHCCFCCCASRRNNNPWSWQSGRQAQLRECSDSGYTIHILSVAMINGRGNLQDINLWLHYSLSCSWQFIRFSSFSSTSFPEPSFNSRNYFITSHNEEYYKLWEYQSRESGSLNMTRWGWKEEDIAETQDGKEKRNVTYYLAVQLVLRLSWLQWERERERERWDNEMMDSVHLTFDLKFG